MTWKVTIVFKSGNVFKDRFQADNLSDLYELIKKKYPNGTITDILGW